MLKWKEMGIKNRLIFIFIIIQILVLGLSFYYVSNKHRELYLEKERMNLEHYSNLILNEIKDNFGTELSLLTEKTEQWSQDTGTRITIIDRTGNVLADSDYNIEDMDNHINREEIAAAIRTTESADSIRYSSTIDEDMLYLAQVIIIDGELIGVIRTARSLEFINSILLEDIKNYLLFFAILSLFIFFLVWQLTSNIVKPLEKITEASEKIAQGDLSQRISIRKYNSEIEKLARMFNHMAAKLEGKISEISQEKNRIEAILKSMVDGVIATDSEGEVSLINPAAQKIFNIDEQDIKGKDLISSLFNHRLDMYLQRALKEKESISREIIYHNPDKKIIQATFIPLLGEKRDINGGVIVLTDITELRKLETVRNDFVANVSHELRTPLTSILGYLDTLIESDIEDQQTREKFLSIIKEETNRLSLLITDLLNLSKIESQSFELSPGDFVKTLQKVYNLLEKNAQLKDIEVNMEVEENPPQVYMVKEQIEQVLINLIDNAIKYSPAGEEINIRVEKKADKLYFSIADNGIGIPQEDQARIFERFYRVDKARSRSLGGTGIGLSIVRNIIKQHGSEIKVESEEGKGSIFTFYLNIVKE
ncbi:MAG: HAMP domain-containing histidine kinase [Halanaerobium sp. MSAO_Bac5]|nr:MAG: HAMP domain-containing histidine kinase [Halanaerobium sp. MSAO_Bac5]